MKPSPAEFAALRDRVDALMAGRGGQNRIGGPGVSPVRNLIRMTEAGSSGLGVRAARSAGGQGIGTLFGHFAVFDVEATIDSAYEGQFREVIRPGAFARSLRERSLMVQFDHGMDPSIGSKPLGLPTAREDRIGLYVEASLDDTSYNRDLAALLRSGALSGASFRFSVAKGGETWESRDGKLPLRILTDLDVYEAGPVSFPAYLAATAGIRTAKAFRDWVEDPTTAHYAPGRAAYGIVHRRVPMPTIKERTQAIARARRLARA